MRACVKYLLPALLLAVPLSWAARSVMANPAVDFLEDIFRKEDRQKRQASQAEPLRPSVRAAPKPQAQISDATFAPPELPKFPDARLLLVVGDEMAEGLAEGLRQTYASEPGIIVKAVTAREVGVISGASTDWGRLIRDALAEKTPSAVIVMFGLNDRQALIDGDRIVEFGDAGWRDIYQTRLDNFLARFGALQARLYWTGLPIMRAQRKTEEANFFSDVFKNRTFTANAHFVDVWEGFVDEEGKYVAIGPDINGNKRRLRKPDGVNFTAAGNRKLAFFVENDLKRDGVTLYNPLIAEIELPQKREGGEAPSGGPAAPAPRTKGFAADYVGAVVQLSPVPYKAGAELAGKPGARDDFAASVLVRGEPAPEHEGRADDARWPPGKANAPSVGGTAQAPSAQPSL